jgi:CHAT domain-containing protein/Tfp pilus assembly protein PilF
MRFTSIHQRLCACLLLWTLLLSGQPAAAQTVSQSDELEAANRLYREGTKLFDLGTSVALRQAIEKLEAALVLCRKIGNRTGEAVTLSFLGKVYDKLGEKKQALTYYNQALPLLRQAKDTRNEAATLNNIGLIYDALGEKREALKFYNSALPALRAVKDRGTEAFTLSNIGLAFDSLGEKQKALNHLQQALAIMRDIKDRKGEAITLNNLGYIYNSLGEKERALDHFLQAFPIFTELVDRLNQVITYNNIAWVYEALDQKETALDYYLKALQVLRELGDRFTEGVTLNNIGLVYRSLGRFKQALDYLGQALKLRQAIGDRPREAITLADTGRVYDDLGQTAKALDYYNQSLRLSREVEDRSVEASTLRRLALLDVKRGRLAEARAEIEASLAIIESLRTRITARELRDSYFASVQEHFETYIALLMRLHRQEPNKGYDALALQASERARARSMLEMLAEAHADIRQGVEPQLLERERRLQGQLTVLAERQPGLISVKQTPAEVDALKQELAAALSEYQQVEALIRSSSPRYAALTQPVPLSLKEIQQQTLDDETVLLEYSLGDKESYLWMVTPTSMKSYELPPRAEIEDAALLVKELLTARNTQIKFETPDEKRLRAEHADRDYAAAAAALSKLVLGPVASELAQKRLLIVADGALNYIPFAALPAPGAATAEKYQPLVIEHEIVALPSASTLAVLRRETKGRAPAPKTLAVIADPVFDKNDERVRASRNEKRPDSGGLRNVTFVSGADTPEEEAASLQRLPYTRMEANEILKRVPASDSKKALDFDASRETAFSPQLGQYRYVHFATHGILNGQYPELSGLVLSLVKRDGTEQDGFLWAHEVFNLRLPVEMVVLSGCRTGLGKNIRGEGIVGMTRGFMYAGASRVIVSLWNISDEASAELMAHLYEKMLGPEHLSPAAALRAAQLAVWKERRWQAPYYWAAFVLQGETK